MTGTNSILFAFIGFGEVGQTFARDLLLNEGVHVSAYDVLFEQPAGERLRKRAGELGVRIAKNAAAAANDAAFVISAVTASQAEGVALEASEFLKPGQIFVDVNSAAPTTKQSAARHVECAHAFYIECAVMAPVLKPGLHVPILAGGPRASTAAQVLNPLGMNITPVSKEFGKASAMKLCRSIMIKGLEALMVDCATASEKWNVKTEVFASLAGTFPSIDWHELAENMRERVATHGVRRSAEMQEAGEMLTALGMAPDLAYAVANAQLRGADKALAR